ncbi:phage GP46 family protein [Sphingomonas sp. CJ99]
MTDIALVFRADDWTADLMLADGQLAADDGLRTAILLSMFTDARARPDDALADGADPRGWWGDGFASVENDAIGSRLWLVLERGKALASTALRARDIVREALAWLIDDRVASAVDVQTMIQPISATRRSAALAIAVTITRPDGRTERFDYVWDFTRRSIA